MTYEHHAKFASYFVYGQKAINFVNRFPLIGPMLARPLFLTAMTLAYKQTLKMGQEYINNNRR